MYKDKEDLFPIPYFFFFGKILKTDNFIDKSFEDVNVV